MTDIAEYERRITSALERASQALSALSAGDNSDVEALKSELDAERVANQQLEERVRAIKEKQESTVARLEAEVSDLRAALTARDSEVQQMRAVNDALRQSNGALRAANAEGLADADLVNAGMAQEVESLRAARASERAEIEEILATLEPVLKEA